MDKQLLRRFVRNTQRFNHSVIGVVLAVILLGTLLITSGCGDEEERTGFDYDSASVALKRIIRPDAKSYYKNLSIPKMIEYESEDGLLYYYIEFEGIFEKSKMTQNEADDYEFSNKIICVVENNNLKDALVYRKSTGTFGESYQTDLFNSYTEVLSNYTYMHELTSEEINDVFTKTKESVNAAYNSDDETATITESDTQS